MGTVAKLGVIGAGVMGAGVAAQAANAGISVLLLDIVPGAATRSVEAMLKASPAPFMHPAKAKLVRAGDLEPDMALLADCDWIVEAIIERPDAKRALYEKLQAVRKQGSVVSSNTSTIPLSALTDGLPPAFAADFMITHFFNPPRYMRLLEIVSGPATRPDAVALIRDTSDRLLGKSVIDCKDTPGFIANRIGSLWAASATRHAIDLGLTVEEADAVMGPPMGVPNTGIFGLMDLVGIDLGPHVASSLLATLPADDAYRSIYREEPLIARLIAEGRTGRKGKGGFYSMQRDGANRTKVAIDFHTGEYRPSVPASLESLQSAGRDLRKLADHPDRGGRYARAVLLDTLSYAASLVPAIADTIDAVDATMRLGYNWKYGPFELIDRLGAEWLATTLRADGRAVPALLQAVGAGTFYRVQDGMRQAFGTDGAYHELARPAGQLLLEDIKLRVEPLAQNGSASLRDIGDGVVCLEFHSKMNALDADIVAIIDTAVALGTKGAFKALVIYNEGRQFSAGANLGWVLSNVKSGAWGQLESLIDTGFRACAAMRAAPFPVVGAPSGMALGGGCEVLLHCDAVQAHAETYMGLVEAGVGLLPGWGGCGLMLSRWAAAANFPKGPMPAVGKVFELISTAQVSKSAADAREFLYLLPTDRITMNRDRLLADAKARAQELAEGYQPPKPVALRLPGPSGRAALVQSLEGFAALGKAKPHDVTVSTYLAEVLSGGDADLTEDTSEEQVQALASQSFLALLRTPETQARIEHMLTKGRPLRN